MINKQFKKPLIQSAIVLMAILFFIGFVAGSGADGFFSGIFSIIKGTLYSLLFVIALFLALVISSSLLIALFFATIALYSPEKSKHFYFQFRQRLSTLLTSWLSCCCNKDSAISLQRMSNILPDKAKFIIGEKKHTTTNTADQTASADTKSPELATLSLAIKALQKEIALLKKQDIELHQSLGSLKNTLADIPVAEILNRCGAVEANQAETADHIHQEKAHRATLEASLYADAATLNHLKSHIEELRKDLAAISDAVTLLKKDQTKNVTPTPENRDDVSAELPRILNYLEKEADKILLIESVKEAVAQNMTYAEIDDFLSKSLPAKVDIIIKEHPSLTKDYIREIKKGD